MTTTQQARGTTARGRRRARVLAALRTAAAPMGVAELAERLGLHPNTLRFHLDSLVAEGRVQRATENRHRPGRPRALYRAVPESPTEGQRSYQVLAEILARHLAAESEDPAAAGIRAGRGWGRTLAGRRSPSPRPSTAEVMRQVRDALTDVGFQPQVFGGHRPRVELHNCPFRELALTQGAVVCSVHLGVVQGMLDALDAPVRAVRADAFVEPALCVVDLERRPRP